MAAIVGDRAAIFTLIRTAPGACLSIARTAR
jgi:hypothetical protein